MAEIDSFSDMTNFEIEAMNLLLNSKASKTALTLSEFIEFARLQGASDKSIKQELLADLEEGGRLFGEFRTSIRATSNGIINRFRDVGQFTQNIDIVNFRWVAVLVNTCPDCIDRHGQTKTMEQWEADGLPRAGFTVCKENCRCVLINASSSFLAPIKRSGRG